MVRSLLKTWTPVLLPGDSNLLDLKWNIDSEEQFGFTTPFLKMCMYLGGKSKFKHFLRLHPWPSSENRNLELCWRKDQGEGGLWERSTRSKKRSFLIF
jgi:hypothetical protein